MYFQRSKSRLFAIEGIQESSFDKISERAPAFAIETRLRVAMIDRMALSG